MVIVDGPPVLGLADAPLLASVCRGDPARRRERQDPHHARRSTRSTGCAAPAANLVGAVLTKYRVRAHGYGYGYGYSYEPYRYGGIGSREREIKLIAQREA